MSGQSKGLFLRRTSPMLARAISAPVPSVPLGSWQILYFCGSNDCRFFIIFKAATIILKTIKAFPRNFIVLSASATATADMPSITFRNNFLKRLAHLLLPFSRRSWYASARSLSSSGVITCLFPLLEISLLRRMNYRQRTDTCPQTAKEVLRTNQLIPCKQLCEKRMYVLRVGCSHSHIARCLAFSCS